ncbi:MAG: hypothetical protein PHS19_02950, partial [Eubacteriales bacterium]|nr:hypothetical protein [Eubacteriales bacterium]
TILIIMFFYENSVEKSKMHLALRCQAGQATEKTVYYIDGIQTDAGNIWDGNISVSHRGLYMIVSGDQTVSIIHKGLLRNRVDNEIYGKWDAIDSAMIRRQK